jgi:peptide deformylase
MSPQSGSVNALGIAAGGVALGGLSPAVADRTSEAEAASEVSEGLIGIDEVQKALNRSRASVYRYTNTDPRNLNPPFNPRKLNPEYRSDQKDPLMFHPNEVARFARDVLRIKEVTVEVLNSPSTATQQLLGAILEELRVIRTRLDHLDGRPADLSVRRDQHDQGARPAA